MCRDRATPDLESGLRQRRQRQGCHPRGQHRRRHAASADVRRVGSSCSTSAQRSASPRRTAGHGRRPAILSTPWSRSRGPAGIPAGIEITHLGSHRRRGAAAPAPSSCRAGDDQRVHWRGGTSAPNRDVSAGPRRPSSRSRNRRAEGHRPQQTRAHTPCRSCNEVLEPVVDQALSQLPAASVRFQLLASAGGGWSYFEIVGVDRDELLHF